MKAVVLAAGDGTRLRPLTFTQPKPLIPVAREPMISYILSQLKREGFEEVIMVVGAMQDQIIDYVGNGSKFGLRITCVMKPREFKSGTAGSLKLIEHLLDDTFLVAQSDTLSEIPLKQAMDFHIKSRSHATIVLTRVEDPSHFGVAVIDNSGAIIEFQEKPSLAEAKSDLVSTGFYILDPSTLDYIENETFDFAMDLFPHLLKLRKKISGFVSDAFWVDAGTLAGYLRGTRWALDNLALAPTSDLRVQGSSVFVANDSEVGSNVLISGPALIEAGAVIEDGASIRPYSVIKRDARVQRGAVVDRSVILEKATVGRDSKVEGCVVGQTGKLRANITAEGSIVGPGSVIGQRANLLAGSRIWPNVQIPAAQTVDGIVFVDLQKAFHFYRSLHEYTGVTASTAGGFVEALEQVPIESIEYHAKRREFEKWVRGVLQSNDLADEMEGLRRKGIIGEELRNDLINITKKWAEQVSTQVIAVAQ